MGVEKRIKRNTMLAFIFSALSIVISSSVIFYNIGYNKGYSKCYWQHIHLIRGEASENTSH